MVGKRRLEFGTKCEAKRIQLTGKRVSIDRGQLVVGDVTLRNVFIKFKDEIESQRWFPVRYYPRGGGAIYKYHSEVQR